MKILLLLFALSMVLFAIGCGETASNNTVPAATHNVQQETSYPTPAVAAPAPAATEYDEAAEDVIPESIENDDAFPEDYDEYEE